MDWKQDDTFQLCFTIRHYKVSKHKNRLVLNGKYQPLPCSSGFNLLRCNIVLLKYNSEALLDVSKYNIPEQNCPDFSIRRASYLYGHYLRATLNALLQLVS
jgi:hypothetical protein